MNKKPYLTLLFSIMSAFTRLIPHPYSMTSVFTSGVFNGLYLKRWQALALSLTGYAITDVILASVQHHPAFGSWSVWTYSGLAIVTLLAPKAHTKNPGALTLSVLGFGVVYWLWTNLGCFLTMPEYSKSVAGFIHCYSLALPFLINQLLGSTLWTLALIYSYKAVTTPYQQHADTTA